MKKQSRYSVVLKMCDRKKCSRSNTISRVWGWVWRVMLKKIVNELSVVTVYKFKIVNLAKCHKCFDARPIGSL